MNDKIIGIAELTFRRVREPAFMFLFLFGVLLGYCVSEMDSFSFQEDIFLSQIPLTAKEKPIMGSFFIITAMSVLIGIFSGASDIPKDIETKVILLLLGKPVKRTEYLVGKYIGIIAICISFFIVSSFSVELFHLLKTGTFHPPDIILRQFALIYAIFPFVAITVTISCFVPEISAMILSVLYVSSCFVFCAIPILMEMLPKSLSLRSPIMAIYYFFPNFYYFFIPMKLSGVVQIFMLLYSLSITVIFLSIANFKFNSRDIV